MVGNHAVGRATHTRGRGRAEGREGSHTPAPPHHMPSPLARSLRLSQPNTTTAVLDPPWPTQRAHGDAAGSGRRANNVGMCVLTLEALPLDVVMGSVWGSEGWARGCSQVSTHAVTGRSHPTAPRGRPEPATPRAVFTSRWRPLRLTIRAILPGYILDHKGDLADIQLGRCHSSSIDQLRDATPR